MAPPRTFDYDLLKRLIREHPDWPYARLAAALTEDVRRTDPHALDILPDAVRRVVHDYRDRWEREGTAVPDRRLGNDIRVPLSRVSENYWMATPTRYLRELYNARQGLAPVGESGEQRRRAVLRWEARLRETGQIVDITSLGEVIVRPATPDELDDEGNPLEVAAWAVPGREPVPVQSRRGRG